MKQLIIISEFNAVLERTMDALIFIDDSPYERAEVRQHLPQVRVPEMPLDVARFETFLERENLFETISFSEEDLKRFGILNLMEKDKKIIVATSGYFDCLHAGHIELFKLAKELGDKLVVIVNNDRQTILKKGREFMPFKERMEIIKAIKYVDEVFPSIDEDETVCKSLEKIKPNIFAKGGDRYAYEIPESAVCKKHGIKIVDGLGKKIQASSELIKKFEGK